MPLPIKKQHIIDRVRDYPHDHYLFMGSILKGVALSVATIALLQIVQNFRSNWTRLFPWAASIAAILVSYITWGRGILVANARGNVGDSIFPLLMGVVEFLLFAVLLNDPNHPIFWLNWFAILAVHALMAVGLVINRIHNSQPVGDFERDVQDLGEKMDKWLHEDRLGASLVGLGAVIAWCGVRWLALPFLGVAWATWIQAGLCVVALGVLLKVIIVADQQRQEIDHFVSN
jgi:hypothetical protein